MVAAEDVVDGTVGRDAMGNRERVPRIAAALAVGMDLVPDAFFPSHLFLRNGGARAGAAAILSGAWVSKRTETHRVRRRTVCLLQSKY